MTINQIYVSFKIKEGYEWQVALSEKIFNKIALSELKNDIEAFIDGYIECLRCETLLLDNVEEEKDNG